MRQREPPRAAARVARRRVRSQRQLRATAARGRNMPISMRGEGVSLLVQGNGVASAQLPPTCQWGRRRPLCRRGLTRSLVRRRNAQGRRAPFLARCGLEAMAGQQSDRRPGVENASRRDVRYEPRTRCKRRCPRLLCGLPIMRRSGVTMEMNAYWRLTTGRRCLSPPVAWFVWGPTRPSARRCLPSSLLRASRVLVAEHRGGEVKK